MSPSYMRAMTIIQARRIEKMDEEIKALKKDDEEKSAEILLLKSDIEKLKGKLPLFG
jgi:peptidoglycan hydrolase CwlO-like protein